MSTVLFISCTIRIYCTFQIKYFQYFSNDIPVDEVFSVLFISSTLSLFCTLWINHFQFILYFPDQPFPVYSVLFISCTLRIYCTFQIKYFDDPVARCMQCIDAVDSRDLSLKCDFFSKLAPTIPLFPKVSASDSILTAIAILGSPGAIIQKNQCTAFLINLSSFVSSLLLFTLFCSQLLDNMMQLSQVQYQSFR